jgi:hypothetical protein
LNALGDIIIDAQQRKLLEAAATRSLGIGDEAKNVEGFFEWIDETQFAFANNYNECCPAE